MHLQVDKFVAKAYYSFLCSEDALHLGKARG